MIEYNEFVKQRIIDVPHEEIEPFCPFVGTCVMGYCKFAYSNLCYRCECSRSEYNNMKVGDLMWGDGMLLEKYNISVTDANGRYRHTYEILQDIADVVKAM